MTEDQARSALAELLGRYTIGSVLHLLADVQREHADEARLIDDAAAYEQLKMIEHTLFVVGLGVDAANPS